jgi:hypothetical protein
LYGNLLAPPVNRCFELPADWPPIRWQIEMHAHWQEDDTARHILSAVSGRAVDPPDPWGELARRLPRVRRMIRDLPADFNRVAAAYSSWLPALADLDPVFAVDALDYQRLKVTLGGAGPAVGGRGEFLTSAFTGAVASVALALASNHFPHIGRLLENPEIGGYWAQVMPGLLSAVLYHKVVTLRDLARAA